MRTETIERTYYSFDELSEEVKDKAVERLWDLNVDYDWWVFIYDDAERIGIEMKWFDEYYNIEKFNANWFHTTIAETILKEHGEQCETYKIAKKFLREVEIPQAMHDIFHSLYEKSERHTFEEELLDEVSDKYADKIEELEEEFLSDLKGEYSAMLRRNYDYLTSREAIIESIKANDYEFTEEGEMI